MKATHATPTPFVPVMYYAPSAVLGRDQRVVGAVAHGHVVATADAPQGVSWRFDGISIDRWEGVGSPPAATFAIETTEQAHAGRRAQRRALHSIWARADVHHPWFELAHGVAGHEIYGVMSAYCAAAPDLTTVSNAGFKKVDWNDGERFTFADKEAGDVREVVGKMRHYARPFPKALIDQEPIEWHSDGRQVRLSECDPVERMRGAIMLACVGGLGDDTKRAARLLDQYLWAILGETDEAMARICRDYLAHHRPDHPGLEQPKPGDVWVCSWGYNQTNIDFYEVDRATAKTVWLYPMATREAPAPGDHTSVLVTPDGRRGPGKALRRKLQRCDRDGGAWSKLSSYKSAHPWDGAPCRATALGYGH